MTDSAERVADLLVERLDLVPPVDIATVLVQHGCVVEECAWPFRCDGVVDLSRQQPRIFVKAGVNPLRRRFTLAHEFGHVVLGWHLNSVVCEVEPDAPETSAVPAGSQEGEASRFASRLLVPERFRRQITSDEPPIGELVERLAQTAVSAAAALIAIKDSLPPGVVLRTPSLTRPIISEGTGTGIRHLAQSGQWAELTRHVDDAGRHPLQGQPVFWYSAWRKEPVPLDDDPRDTTTLLRDLLAQAAPVGADEEALRRSIVGVVGASFSDPAITDPAVLYGIARQRFAAQPRYASLTGAADFDLYLRRKAHEIAKRRQAS